MDRGRDGVAATAYQLGERGDAEVALYHLDSDALGEFGLWGLGHRVLDKVNKCGPNPHVNAKVDKINNTAARFREVRKLLKLTQQQLANQLHIKRNTVAKIESGSAQPSARTVSSLEELLIKSTSPEVDIILVEPKQASLEEAPVAYGEVAKLREQIRRKLDDVLAAAGEDRVRLGWILLQINEHVKPQKHWRETSTRGEAKLEQLKTEARQTKPGAHAESA